MTDTPARSSYDEVPYPSIPFVQSHPNRLATVATVFGMEPPPVEGCRVLELGCARGDNLIPLALGLPRGAFVGIDLSAGQIADGRAVLEDLGLENVDLRQMDLLDFPPEMGSFDYVIAHGIYSWVPAEVRDRILDICKRHLNPNGVAYVSYNVYPGWRLRGVVRDIMQFHLNENSDTRARIKKSFALLDFFCDAIPETIAPYRTIFTNIRRQLTSASHPESILFHELLEEVNEPVYFHQFAAHAAGHGLQFLAEADVSEMQTDSFPPQVSERLQTLAEDIVGREQYLDFLKNKTFRQTLLCHDDVTLRRELQPERLNGLHVAANLKCEAPEADLRSSEALTFRDSNGVEGSTEHSVTKAALVHLSEIWPEAARFEELAAAARARLVPNSVVMQAASDYDRDTRTLAGNLLKLFTAGSVELHVHPPQFAREVSERPVASRWARRQAESGPRITNLRHDGIDMSDVSRRLLGLMDGTRDRAQLLEELVRHVTEDGLVVLDEGKPVREPRLIREVLQARLEETLQAAAKSALLTG